MLKKLWRRLFGPKTFKVEIWAYDKDKKRRTFYHDLEHAKGCTDQEVMDDLKLFMEDQGYKVVFMTKVHP